MKGDLEGAYETIQKAVAFYEQKGVNKGEEGIQHTTVGDSHSSDEVIDIHDNNNGGGARVQLPDEIIKQTNLIFNELAIKYATEGRICVCRLM